MLPGGRRPSQIFTSTQVRTTRFPESGDGARWSSRGELTGWRPGPSIRQRRSEPKLRPSCFSRPPGPAMLVRANQKPSSPDGQGTPQLHPGALVRTTGTPGAQLPPPPPRGVSFSPPGAPAEDDFLLQPGGILHVFRAAGGLASPSHLPSLDGGDRGPLHTHPGRGGGEGGLGPLSAHWLSEASGGILHLLALDDLARTPMDPDPVPGPAGPGCDQHPDRTAKPVPGKPVSPSAAAPTACDPPLTSAKSSLSTSGKRQAGPGRGRRHEHRHTPAARGQQAAPHQEPHEGAGGDLPTRAPFPRVETGRVRDPCPRPAGSRSFGSKPALSGPPRAEASPPPASGAPRARARGSRSPLLGPTASVQGEANPPAEREARSRPAAPRSRPWGFHRSPRAPPRRPAKEPRAPPRAPHPAKAPRTPPRRPAPRQGAPRPAKAPRQGAPPRSPAPRHGPRTPPRRPAPRQGAPHPAKEPRQGGPRPAKGPRAPPRSPASRQGATPRSPAPRQGAPRPATGPAPRHGPRAPPRAPHPAKGPRGGEPPRRRSFPGRRGRGRGGDARGRAPGCARSSRAPRRPPSPAPAPDSPAPRSPGAAGQKSSEAPGSPEQS
ncbi:basic salivary proline-rich protein 1-like [Perognathus longimembris pacificus]|uniref:basic salivary proline-rich protein 1-like n=1 Tax=Perognathus longimembris pacificus TaxID=214514 RepID=UPI002019DF30|nr:basic salivary proline-rich protein 1-like [Perognathus longimembris pacificus]